MLRQNLIFMKNNNEKGKQKKEAASTEESIKKGKQAIDMEKKTAPTENEKKESTEKKDAEQWRNEG